MDKEAVVGVRVLATTELARTTMNEADYHRVWIRELNEDAVGLVNCTLEVSVEK